ncbi:uncharacterized protein [Antedon mediterranea]|uniref:uncharacterized protein n=1 Tax=Antedon mediterranea TaxID=105859 RepID=UPI003AF7E301
MGCNSSKVDIQPRSSSDAWSSNKPTSKKGRPNSNLVRVKPKNKSDADVTKEQPPQTEIIVQKDSNQNDFVVDGTPVNRGISSATSKTSTHTFDSGLEADYAHVITESCDPNLIKTVEEENRPPTPEFMVSGTQIEARKRSGGKRRNKESADILAELQSQGIVTRPASRFGGGLAFEVNLDSSEENKQIRPPPRLAKLKKKKKKSKKTKEEIDAKIQAAEERRKKKEAEMIERLNTARKEIQVQTALDESERSQKKQLEVKIDVTQDKAAENRKARMEALKEKLKQKQRHAEKVRQAKIERMKEGKHESEMTSEV